MSDTYDKDIADNLVHAVAEAKRTLGKTTAELARRMTATGRLGDVKPQTLINFLARKRGRITIGELVTLCELLHLDPLSIAPDLAKLQVQARADLRNDLVAAINSRLR